LNLHAPIALELRAAASQDDERRRRRDALGKFAAPK
jgi:hypothetical protein